MKNIRNLFIYLFLITIAASAFAQGHISTQSHQSQITAVKSVPMNSGNEFAYFTSGDDGFLIRWNENNEGEHYQLSDVGIKKIAVSPNGK